MENLTFRKGIVETRFEFLLLINGNIICQRYFTINGFNEDSIKSLETKYVHDYCVSIIKEHLKAKTVDYLWEFYNPYKEQSSEDIPRGDIYEKEDVYGFQIRVDKRNIIESTFTGNVYPPKVRYQVDVKELIPRIIGEIREGLTLKKYSNTWGELTF